VGYCPTNGSTTKHTVQNTAKHTGKRTARQVYADYYRRRRNQAKYGEGGRYDQKRTSPLVAKATSKRMAADASADDRESKAHQGVDAKVVPNSTAVKFDPAIKMAGPCASGTAAAGTMLGVQACAMGTVDNWIDGKVALVITGTPFTQSTANVGATATAGIGLTNARNRQDLDGWFGNVGADGTVATWALTGDYAVGQATDGNIIYMGDIGVGRGQNVVPGGIHGGATVSGTFDLDLADVPAIVNPWAVKRAIGEIGRMLWP
jgi:ribosomal protein L44E